MATSSLASRAHHARLPFCWLAALGLFAGAVSTKAPHFYPDDPIAREPESQDASKAQPYSIGSLYEMIVQPVRHVGLQAVGHARAEHQHDRRGARLELVHEPDRLDPGHGRRARARPQSRAPPRTRRAGC